MQQPQSYQQPEDLYQVQQALMQWTQDAGDCNYWHKGDIRHRLFNGGYQLNPSEMLHIWRDETGTIKAFSQIYPNWGMLDLHVAPDVRFTEFHREVFQWSEEALIAYAERIGKPLEQFTKDSMGCDPRYDEFLRSMGYTYSEQALNLTEHDLQNIPEATLPDGFHFHDATIDDLTNLADVHNNSFTNKWTAEIYGKVFQSPYQEYEIVTVAPDGRFASFTQVWVDDVNKTILFEPVGTHADFRRRGIGKAMMVYVLKRMKAEHSIERAYVCHELPDKNPASGALYASVGFRVKYPIHDYKKVLPLLKF